MAEHKIRLATWNINSARLRIEQILKFLNEQQPDILALQEIKCLNDQFPREAIEKAGYQHIALNGQKGYHGVATLSRLPFAQTGVEHFGGNEESRHLVTVFDGPKRNGAPLQLHNFYVPAGGDVPDPDANPKFRHKLDYLTDMANWFGARKEDGLPMVLVGDLNIAPLENDVWSHRQMLKVVSHTPVEVEHLARVARSCDWIDAMRCHVDEDEKLFTWWSYRAKDWKVSNRGRRLDHVWLSPPLAGTCTHMQVVEDARSWERPSDHAPVLVELVI